MTGKSLFIRFFVLINLFFVLFLKLSFGQDNSRNSIQFKGGVFSPTPITDWNKFEFSNFNSELINNYYYLLIQFHALPTEEQKNLYNFPAFESIQKNLQKELIALQQQYDDTNPAAPVK
jgi:hypothetical protein